MSVLLRRSLLVLALLFGLLFAVGTAVLWHYEAPIWLALIFAVVVVGLQYLLGPYIIGWIFKINWIHPHQVSPELARFLEDTCSRDRIPVPAFGVIEDGNPNAFTYGHTPADARVVVTRGLIDMLNADELNAVVGHEPGHIKHWDFVVMTVASLVPLLLYYIYLWVRFQGEGRSRNQSAWIIAIVSYVAYIISQYIALFLSRIREYYADYYAARTTRNPNALATALVTIAYGLAKAQPPAPKDDDDKKKKKSPGFDATGAIASLSFFNKKGASHFAMAASDVSGNFSAENMRKAMRWDLYNPWARWFELNSTHPLPARRIREVQKYAGYAKETPVYAFGEAAPSYWSKFIADLAVLLLPYAGAIIGLGLAWAYSAGQPDIGLAFVGFPISLLGLGWLLRLRFAYSGNFRPSTIVSLITETDVSHVRPIPAVIKGKVIGRGVPGLFWSDDLVLQDENGFITLIYRQPLRFLEFLFGWLKAESFIGRNAVVHGWYRRGPGPHFEMREAIFDDGETVRCHYYHFLLAMSLIMTIFGAALAFIRL